MPAGPTRTLAAFAAGLTRAAIPDAVFRRAEDLFVDWAGSALAGRPARAVQAVDRFAAAMGPGDGPSEVLISGRRTSPYFAAMVNAAASHVAEQDDVHNGSVFHPAAVVFPPALATAQAIGGSGEALMVAAVAGYEVGVRIGEYLGRSHYRIFHTTGTVGTIAAAAAVGRLLGLDAEAMNHAFGSAGTQSAGLWEFLRDAADSKQLHTAHAAAAGLASAWLAREGFTGARAILEGGQGLAAGMSSDADPARLTDGLGSRWATAETSFKYHASCRHSHPAADALLKAMRDHDLRPDQIDGVTALVHQGAIDVLGQVTVPETVHQAKFSMGSVLGLIAHGGTADLATFETVLDRPEVAAFRDRVVMVCDPEVDAAYPRRWIGKVAVTTVDGRRIEVRVDEPKGDPGNSLTREEISAKATALARFGGFDNSADALVARLWTVADAERIGMLL
ncbi:2-methylcitrate dehydratase [Sphingomonas sp. Root50]|nr:2-methylcitrate dehydratase [Sphingomonas sp. Root1294]KQY65892.1 2-methylcitrate dehydratase [Sphingomonas sp. Root50]KRB95538.1 2-methylcitrate dehydratase [Sphingomonas sp. Root720]